MQLDGGVCFSLALGLVIGSVSAGGAQETALHSWGYNSFGTPGLIDMPGAHSVEDGELSFSASHFRKQTRGTLSFQISDRLSASFRYSSLYGTKLDPTLLWTDRHRLDRSFSLHYRFLDEGSILPTMAIGLNDMLGTGIYSGEYVVATKTFTPQLRATLGMGWGRLGSSGGFDNPLGVIGNRFKTRGRSSNALGGTFQPELWFRGDAAFFGGIEWRMNPRTRVVVEYSSDDYAREDGIFERKSSVNLGLDWQANDRTSLSARYLYGSEFGFQVTYALNPKRSRHGSGRESAPTPVMPRKAALHSDWQGVERGGFAARLRADLVREGLLLEGMTHEGTVLRISVRNTRYNAHAQGVGRAARILTRHAPASVERFDIRLTSDGMSVTSVLLQRSDIEELEFHTVAPDLLRVNTRILDAPDPLPPVAGLYPRLEYGLEPYLSTSFFDPSDPVRADLGLALTARLEPVAGLVFSGRVHQKIVGNQNKGNRPSNSVLPHVRSDSYLYAKVSGPTLQHLTAAYYFRPGTDLFGRVTAGYLESMFGGISAELLWKPQNSALALGVEVNHSRQRDFDHRFSFQDYKVATGHISAYYALGGGYNAQLDVGRYLAGDVGATLTLDREFDNGWKLGLFATKTDVSAADFGEGSFDKGIILTIPLDWATGRPSQTLFSQTIRPLLRDGGARLHVPGRLYDGVRGMQASTMDASWGRFWK